MKCPVGLTWIPDREYCSRCQPGYAWNAEWGECVKMDRSVISPGNYPTASSALFGYDRSSNEKILIVLGIMLSLMACYRLFCVKM